MHRGVGLRLGIEAGIVSGVVDVGLTPLVELGTVDVSTEALVLGVERMPRAEKPVALSVGHVRCQASDLHDGDEGEQHPDGGQLRSECRLLIERRRQTRGQPCSTGRH